MHPTYLPSAQCPVPSLPPMAEMETSNFLQLQQLPTSLLAGSTVVGLLHLSLWQIQITDLNRPQVGKEKKKKSNLILTSTVQNTQPVKPTRCIR